MVREKNWWPSSATDNPSSPPPITYLLSNDVCMETHQTPPLAHCKSCSCFSPLPIANNVASTTVTGAVPASTVPDQHSLSVSISECTGKSLKWPRPLDLKPTVQHQSTSTAADCQASEVSKNTVTTNATSRKEKDTKPPRKFGLSLFRRNVGKKDKPKKEYVAFSGQFPPEEWPVRDEDDLNNLPRDLEHAIIKRINPELTVDNLNRHTVLMKKIEERRDKGLERVIERGLDKDDKLVDKGMSTEMLSCTKPRHHHSAKATGGRRSALKASRSKRRVHSSREKQREREKDKDRVRSKVSKVDDLPVGEDLIPTRLKVEIPVDQPDHLEESGTVEGKCLYKKRIDNPFQAGLNNDPSEVINTSTSTSREHRRREAKECKTSGQGRKERTSHRSKSWDPQRAKIVLAEGEQTGRSPNSEDRYDCLQLRDQPLQIDLKPTRELTLDYSSAYPQSSTLRIDDKVRHQKGAREIWDKDEHDYKGIPDRNQTDANYLDPGRLHAPLTPNATLQRKHSLRIAKPQGEEDCRNDKHMLHHQPCEISVSANKMDLRTNTTIEQTKVQAERLEPASAGNTFVTDTSNFIEDDCKLYERADEKDEDACSSLCLSEEVADAAVMYQAAVAHYHDPQLGYKLSFDLKYQGSDSHCCNSYFQAAPFTQEGRDSTYRGGSESGNTSSKVVHYQQKTRSHNTETRPRQGATAEHHSEVSLSLDCPGTPEVADCSIFDYCQTSEVESDTETVRKSTDEGDGESAQWTVDVEIPKENFGTLNKRGVLQAHRSGLSISNGAIAEVGEPVEMIENQSMTGDSGIDSPR